jgi:hypothetical protein
LEPLAVLEHKPLALLGLPVSFLGHKPLALLELPVSFLEHKPPCAVNEPPHTNSTDPHYLHDYRSSSRPTWSLLRG